MIQKSVGAQSRWYLPPKVPFLWGIPLPTAVERTRFCLRGLSGSRGDFFCFSPDFCGCCVIERGAAGGEKHGKMATKRPTFSVSIWPAGRASAIISAMCYVCCSFSSRLSVPLLTKMPDYFYCCCTVLEHTHLYPRNANGLPHIQHTHHAPCTATAMERSVSQRKRNESGGCCYWVLLAPAL